jgi:hypothetical protein
MLLNPSAATNGREVLSKPMKRQRDVPDGLSPQLESMSLAQLLTRRHEDWLPRQAKESTKQNYWSDARIHSIPILGAKRLSALPSLDVDRFLAARARHGCAARGGVRHRLYRSPQTVRRQTTHTARAAHRSQDQQTEGGHHHDTMIHEELCLKRADTRR